MIVSADSTWAFPGIREPQNLRISNSHALANNGSKLMFSLYERENERSLKRNEEVQIERTRWRSSNFNSSRHASLICLVFFNTPSNMTSARHWTIEGLNIGRDESLFISPKHRNTLGLFRRTMLSDLGFTFRLELLTEECFILQTCLQQKESHRSILVLSNSSLTIWWCSILARQRKSIFWWFLYLTRQRRRSFSLPISVF